MVLQGKAEPLCVLNNLHRILFLDPSDSGVLSTVKYVLIFFIVSLPTWVGLIGFALKRFSGEFLIHFRNEKILPENIYFIMNQQQRCSRLKRCNISSVSCWALYIRLNLCFDNSIPKFFFLILYCVSLLRLLYTFWIPLRNTNNQGDAVHTLSWFSHSCIAHCMIFWVWSWIIFSPNSFQNIIPTFLHEPNVWMA